VAGHFSDPRELRDVIPESDQQNTSTGLVQPDAKIFDLSAFAGTVNAREAD
jgi:hypothetical protein